MIFISMPLVHGLRCIFSSPDFSQNSTIEIFTNPLLAGAKIVDDVAILPTCVGLGLSGDPARVLSRHVASSLVRLCAALCPSSRQPEVFYTPGPTAEKMSKEFIAAAVEEAVWQSQDNKGKAVSNKAFELPPAEGGARKTSLILVDRAADLVGLCGHWSGSVAESAFASDEFPHLSGHTSDVAIHIPRIGNSEHTA